jgi:ribosomal protein L28
MSHIAFKFPRVASIGNRVSHAKNRSKHAFKYNLHSATVIINGTKQKVRVPTSVLRQLKKSGLTSHFKPAAK